MNERADMPPEPPGSLSAGGKLYCSRCDEPYRPKRTEDGFVPMPSCRCFAEWRRDCRQTGWDPDDAARLWKADSDGLDTVPMRIHCGADEFRAFEESLAAVSVGVITSGGVGAVRWLEASVRLEAVGEMLAIGAEIVGW